MQMISDLETSKYGGGLKVYKGSQHRIPHTPSQQAPRGRGPPKGANRQSSTYPDEAPAETSLIQKEVRADR